jgi:predicted phage-related endonuclease
MDKVFPELVKPTEVTEAMELGHAAEPIIVERVARKRGLAVSYPHATVRHPEIEWAMATPDAMIVNAPGVVGLLPENTKHEPLGLVETKLVGTHVAPHWGETYEEGEGPPDHVYVQAIWQLFVKQLPYCVVGAMIGTEIRTYRIDFDSGAQEYAEVLVEMGEKFLTDHVRPRREPPMDGSQSNRDMLSSLFKKSSGVYLKADAEAEQAARAYFDAKRDRDAAVERMDAAKTALMDKIRGDHGIQGDGWRALWSEQKGYTVPAYEVTPMRKFDLRPVKAR